MIFVTVGTHTQGFERLVKAVDELAGSGKIKEKVIMQIGNTKYEPKHCEWFRFECFKKIIELNNTARLVITHAGAGCILTALRFGKPLIIMPRRKKFGEHTDDHQADIAEALDKNGTAIAIHDASCLEQAIHDASGLCLKKEKARIVSNLKAYLKEFGEPIKLL